MGRKAKALTTEEGLTLAELEFCNEVIRDPYHNLQGAYRKTHPNTDPSQCTLAARAVARRPAVARYLAAQVAEIQFRLEINREKVLREIAYSAFVDPRELFTESGQLKPIVDLPQHVAAAIGSIEVVRKKQSVIRTINNETGAEETHMVEDQLVKIKFNDKLNALQQLGKTAELGLFVDAEREEHATTQKDIDALSFEEATAEYHRMIGNA